MTTTLSQISKLSNWIASGTNSNSTTTKQRRDNVKNITKILSNDQIALTLLTSIYEKQQQQQQQQQQLDSTKPSNSTSKYDTLNSHYNTLNRTHGDIDIQKYPEIKDNIDTLIHLATLLSTDTTHPNQIIISVDAILQKNKQAKAQFQAAHQKLIEIAQQTDDANQLDQKLELLECIEPRDGITTVMNTLTKKKSIVPSNDNDLNIAIKILKKKRTQWEAKYIHEKEQLTSTVDMYGKASGHYSFEDLDRMEMEIVQMKEHLEERTRYLQAFQDLPPDYELALFRLTESQAEYQALQLQLEEVKIRLEEE